MFSSIEFLTSGIIYTITDGVAMDAVTSYLESSWGSDMRWQFYGDRRVLVYRAWTAPEDESESDED